MLFSPASRRVDTSPVERSPRSMRFAVVVQNASAPSITSRMPPVLSPSKAVTGHSGDPPPALVDVVWPVDPAPPAPAAGGGPGSSLRAPQAAPTAAEATRTSAEAAAWQR